VQGLVVNSYAGGMLWPCSQYEADSVRLLGLLFALIELTHPGGHADIAIDERQCPLLAQSGHP
jgi:hypothetical protein